MLPYIAYMDPMGYIMVYPPESLLRSPSNLHQLEASPCPVLDPSLATVLRFL